MRKLTILFALLTLSAGMWAETIDNVHCLDANGEELTIDNVNVVTDASEQVTWGEAGKTTWYVVTNFVKLSQGAVCQGDVRLILSNGCTLTAKGGIDKAGIEVSGEGNSLTIYGQSAQSGQLFANGGYSAAGIGGGNKGSGSNITINGGIVTANGGVGGAGIGGGEQGSGSNITINGGKVTATGGIKAAGIGGGNGGSCSNITINGGTVIATGGSSGAGIGGGDFGSGSNITINGGEVIATGGSLGAGIGGGNEGSGSITINGGTITATGGDTAAGIGGGNKGSGSNITINGGIVTANGGGGGAGIGGGNSSPGSANLSIPASYRIKIGKNYIHHNGTDLVNILADKTNVYAYPDNYFEERNAYMAAIHAAVEGIANETILAMAAQGIEDIFQAEGGINDIDNTKQKVLADLEYVLSFYNSGDAAGYARGKEEGKSEALGILGTKQNGPAIIVTDQDGNEIILYSPKSVEYIKVNE